MHASYLDFLVNCLLVVSTLELATFLGVCIWDGRKKIQSSVRASLQRETPDPFPTWANMLERQRDRRDDTRYGGVERRSKVAYSHWGAN